MSDERHDIFDGRVHLYKRERSQYWQCATFLGGVNHRVSSKETIFANAKTFAEEWYLDLRTKIKTGENAVKRGELVQTTEKLVARSVEKKFKEAAEQFLREYEIITEGQRNAHYVKGHRLRLKNHLLPFFGDMYLSHITAGSLQEYRIHRREKEEKAARDKELAREAAGEETKKSKKKKPERPVRKVGPARSTIHQEIVVLRQVLKAAVRHKWLASLPDLSEAYRASTKISHRAWFSPEEYKKLYEATRKRAINPKKSRFKWESEQLHDYVLFMANTGVRPDEAARLEHRDVAVIKDQDSGETILEIAVRGKRGVGYCKSMPGAVLPYRRLVKRNKPKQTDRLFPKTHAVMFNQILTELDLKFDREGQRRTFYSLRHTYICLRLMEGADIYQLAKNCRTSVEMIEKFYATHLKNMIDASAVNVRKSRIKKIKEGEALDITT